MLLILVVSSLLNISMCNNIPNDDKLKIEFKKGKIKYLETTDVCANVFGFFINKEKRWNNNIPVDLKEFDIKIYELIEEFFTCKDLIKLNLKTFSQIIILIDFLGLENKNYQDKISKFWTNLINSVYDLIINQNCKLSNRYIVCLKHRNVLMLELFYRCLRYVKPSSSLEYKNGDLLFFLDERDHNIVSNNVVIKNEDDDTFLKEDADLKKLIFWFGKSLDLTKIFIFEYYFEINVIIFDKKCNDNLQLSNIILILEKEFEPYYLKLDNVLKNGTDLSIFKNLSKLGNLEINSSKLLDITISDFEMKSLTVLKISNAKITIQDLNSSFMISNLSSLILISCHVNDSKIDSLKCRDLNMDYLRIEKCLIDNLFFEFYTKMQSLERIDFLNNQSSCMVEVQEQEDIFFDKFVDYHICCFSKSQIKSLMIQKNINHIKMECCTQIIELQFQHEIFNNLSRHNNFPTTGIAKRYRDISIIERIY